MLRIFCGRESVNKTLIRKRKRKTLLLVPDQHLQADAHAHGKERTYVRKFYMNRLSSECSGMRRQPESDIGKRRRHNPFEY